VGGWGKVYGTRFLFGCSCWDAGIPNKAEFGCSGVDVEDAGLFYIEDKRVASHRSHP
jgi:hypothetical protein